jgi:hypothetical protein
MNQFHPPSSIQVTSQLGHHFALATNFLFFKLEKIISTYAKDFSNKMKAIIHQISKENKNQHISTTCYSRGAKI